MYLKLISSITNLRSKEQCTTGIRIYRAKQLHELTKYIKLFILSTLLLLETSWLLIQYTNLHLTMLHFNKVTGTVTPKLLQSNTQSEAF